MLIRVIRAQRSLFGRLFLARITRIYTDCLPFTAANNRLYFSVLRWRDFGSLLPIMNKPQRHSVTEFLLWVFIFYSMTIFSDSVVKERFSAFFVRDGAGFALEIIFKIKFKIILFPCSLQILNIILYIISSEATKSMRNSYRSGSKWTLFRLQTNLLCTSKLHYLKVN